MQSTLSRTSSRLASGLAAASLVLLLSACGDSSDSAKTAEPAKTETSTPATTDAKPATAETTPATDAKPATTDTAAATTEAKPADAKPATAEAKPVELPKVDGTVDMAKVLEAGPLPEMSIGKADAPVTIVEYMSMTCPHCAKFHNETFEAIKEKYVDTGKVRFILREFPLDPAAAAAIMLARCAPEGQYFPMVSVLFKQQMTWAAGGDVRGALLQMSKLAGFTQESFEACLTNQKLLDQVNAVREKGSKEFGVAATPTFLINGSRYSGEMTVDQMSSIIDSDL